MEKPKIIIDVVYFLRSMLCFGPGLGLLGEGGDLLFSHHFPPTASGPVTAAVHSSISQTYRLNSGF